MSYTLHGYFLGKVFGEHSAGVADRIPEHAITIV